MNEYELEKNTMLQRPVPIFAICMLVYIATGFFSVVRADQQLDQLESRMALLEDTIAKLRTELSALRKESIDATATVQDEHEEIRQTESALLASSSEWQNVTSSLHLAGYGAVRYADKERTGGEFDSVSFNPIFHFLYRDKILWESELEIEIEEEGATEVHLEYSTIDWFVNDYVTLVAGKFLSPLGQFRQNLHPAWINKLASAPPGFGHDGAAPEAATGLQFRGGFPFGDGRQFTYAAYVANGPELEGDDGEVHGILTEGFTRDADDPVFGGRLALLPMSNLEIGLSGALGEASVTINDEDEFEGDPARDYESFGADFLFRWQDFESRGEYISQDVENSPGSIAAQGGKWDSWYLQASYRIGSLAIVDEPFEIVARYADFGSPHASQQQEQWAFGLNYLLAPNAVIKFSYELNDGIDGAETDADRWLAQIAYGY